MEFAVRYLPQGAESVLEERLEGPDAPAVRLRLQESGSVVLSVKPVAAAAPPRWALRSEFDVAWWCKERET